MKKQISVLLLAGLTAGCSVPGEKDFLCGAQSGQPCQTLSEVDGSSTSGGEPVAERLEDSQADTLSQQPLFGGKRTASSGVAMLSGGAPYVSQQYRVPEKTGTLWVAPRKDDAEILHEATYVHFVIWDAHWGNK